MRATRNPRSGGASLPRLPHRAAGQHCCRPPTIVRPPHRPPGPLGSSPLCMLLHKQRLKHCLFGQAAILLCPPPPARPHREIAHVWRREPRIAPRITTHSPLLKDPLINMTFRLPIITTHYLFTFITRLSLIFFSHLMEKKNSIQHPEQSLGQQHRT